MLRQHPVDALQVVDEVRPVLGAVKGGKGGGQL